MYVRAVVVEGRTDRERFTDMDILHSRTVLVPIWPANLPTRISCRTEEIVGTCSKYLVVSPRMNVDLNASAYKAMHSTELPRSSDETWPNSKPCFVP